MDNVDYTQMTAADGEGDDPLHDPLVRALRSIIPHHPMWADPVKVKQFRDGLRDAMSMDRDGPKGATPKEEARVRQESADPEDEAMMTRESEDKFWGDAEGWRREKDRFRRL